MNTYTEDEYTEVASYFAEQHERRIQRRENESLKVRDQQHALIVASEDHAAMRRAMASNGLDY